MWDWGCVWMCECVRVCLWHKIDYQKQTLGMFVCLAAFIWRWNRKSWRKRLRTTSSDIKSRLITFQETQTQNESVWWEESAGDRVQLCSFNNTFKLHFSGKVYGHLLGCKILREWELLWSLLWTTKLFKMWRIGRMAGLDTFFKKQISPWCLQHLNSN